MVGCFSCSRNRKIQSGLYGFEILELFEMKDTEWLDVIIDGEMVEINGKGEIRKPKPGRERK